MYKVCILSIILLIMNIHCTSKNVILDGLVPVGLHKAEIHQLKASPKLESISLKFMTAIKKNKEWFQGYTSNYSPGKTLPWHENMGVSPLEYKYFTENMNKLKFRKTHDTVVKFSKQKNRILVTSDNKWPFFEKLKVIISPDYQTINTAFTKLTYRRSIKSSKEQRVTGPWAGYCWSNIKTHTRNNEEYTSICIGKLVETHQHILIYEARSKDKQNPYLNSDFALYY